MYYKEENTSSFNYSYAHFEKTLNRMEILKISSFKLMSLTPPPIFSRSILTINNPNPVPLRLRDLSAV